MKIILIVGARPNFMKIAPIIRAIKSFNQINLSREMRSLFHRDQTNQINQRNQINQKNQINQINQPNEIDENNCFLMGDPGDRITLAFLFS